MTVKLKWKVQPAPTGRYRSFQTRGWPSAVFKDNDQVAVHLYCAEDYTPVRAASGQHSPIKVCLAIYNQDRSNGKGAFDWKVLIQRAQTLDEAKYLAQSFWDRNYGTRGPDCVKATPQNILQKD